MASKKWEDLTLEKVANKFEPTYLGIDQPRVGLEDQPNFKVYEFSPNRKLDGNNRYLLAGPEWSIMQQSSMLKAEHDLLADRIGFGYTFEDWFQDWSEGFRWGINRTGTTGMRTNYPIRSNTEGDDTVPGWREDRETRPAYLEWRNPNPNLNKGYHVIEYWRNRSVDKSIVLVGSYAQIAQQILQIEYEGGGTAGGESEDKPLGGFLGEYSGTPLVSLYFNEKEEDVEEGYARIQGKVRFRLVGKSADPDSLLPKLTGADVKQLALRIQQAFLVPEPFSYRRGKEQSKVVDPNRGLLSWQYVYSETEGWNLYSRVYQAMGMTPNDTKFRHSFCRNPSEAFPTVPPTVNVIGSNVKKARQRPVGTVHFTSAKLFLTELARPVVLCDNKGALFQSLDDSDTNVS